MDFSTALKVIKEGTRVRRTGWNGKGMHVHLVNDSWGGKRPYLEMKDAQGLYVPWLASQTDLLADDWELVD